MKNTQTKEEAIESVKNGNLSYYNRLLNFAYAWCKLRHKEFTSEDLKEAFFKLGNEEPEQPNVIGSVFYRLAKESRIYPHGSTTAKNKVAHGRLLRKWISHEFKFKQQQNRKQEQSLNLFEQ
jgi:hypothetical protein